MFTFSHVVSDNIWNLKISTDEQELGHKMGPQGAQFNLCVHITIKGKKKYDKKNVCMTLR